MESGCQEDRGQDPPTGNRKGETGKGQHKTALADESGCRTARQGLQRATGDTRDLSTPVIPAFEKLRHKSGEFRASLDYRARLCLKKKKKISWVVCVLGDFVSCRQ